MLRRSSKKALSDFVKMKGTGSTVDTPLIVSVAFPGKPVTLEPSASFVVDAFRWTDTPAGVLDQALGNRIRPVKPVSSATRMGRDRPIRTSTAPLLPVTARRPSIVWTGTVTVAGSRAALDVAASVSVSAWAGVAASAVSTATSSTARPRSVRFMGSPPQAQ